MDSKTRESLDSDLVAKIIEKNRLDLEKIGLCKTDEDRVNLTLTGLNDSAHATRECPNGKKSLEESEKFRHSGNLLFNSSSPDLREVLEHYLKSILHAPPGSQQLSMAYANRSAVLFRAEYYEECLKDINRALKAGYPDSLKPKLLIRKATCNYALTGNVDFDTDEGLIEARGLIEKLSATNKVRKMVEDTLNDPAKITSVGRQVTKTQPKYQPGMKERNPHLPGASDAIALKYSEEFGRHLVATRDINAGEVLLMETPYAMIVPDKWIHCICCHCTKGAWNGIPCDYCIYAMFCSDECKRAAWQEYHEVECEVLGNVKMMKDLSNYMLMGLRLTVKAIKEAGSVGVLRKRLEKLDSVKASDVEIPIDPNSYETFYLMSDHPERYESNYLVVCSSIAGRLTYPLAVRTDLLGEREVADLLVVKDSGKFLFVAGLMSRNIRIAKNRTFGLTMGDKDKTTVDQIILLMPVSSFLNNRCYDAAEMLRFNEYPVLVTPIPISRGDQVFTQYYTNYKQTPRDLRREHFKDHWQFVCNCLACAEDWSSSTATWDFQHLTPGMIQNIFDEMKKFKSRGDTGDPIEMIPLIDHFCRLIDFTYPRVKIPSISVEFLVDSMNQIYKFLSPTVFPRITDKP